MFQLNCNKIFLLCLLIGNQLAIGQTTFNPDQILVPDKNQLPKILLVGTFHFEYYNADAYKVDKSKQLDILSAQKQKELHELLDYIARFKPNKICIEAPVNKSPMAQYHIYQARKKELGKNEIEQIAFRLLDKFKLDTLYSIDAASLAQDLSASKDSTVFQPYFDKIFENYSFKSNEHYTALFKQETELSLQLSLLDYFFYLNSAKHLQRDFGSYLLGDFKNGNYEGADALASYWYDRNLRIFRNIQRITNSPKDRILVLFGSGHIAILDQLLQCSPEYDYIKFDELKK